MRAVEPAHPNRQDREDGESAEDIPWIAGGLPDERKIEAQHHGGKDPELGEGPHLIR